MWIRILCVVGLALSMAACGEDTPDEFNENANANTNDNGDGNNQVSVDCVDTFDMADACGGDATGTWTLGEVCGVDVPAEAAGLAEQCPTAEISNLAYDVNGTLTIDSENFTESLNGTVSADVTIPSECLVFNDTPIDCTTLQVVVNTEDGLSATCAEDANGGCDCAITADLAFETTGSYTAASGVATVTTSEGTVEYYYCAENGQMTLRETATSNPAGRPIFAYGQ